MADAGPSSRSAEALTIRQFFFNVLAAILRLNLPICIQDGDIILLTSGDPLPTSRSSSFEMSAYIAQMLPLLCTDPLPRSVRVEI